MQEVRNVYQPDAIVFQCGADCLNGDPLGGFNLTNHGLANCVKFIAEWSLPLLVLGGGSSLSYHEDLYALFEFQV